MADFDDFSGAEQPPAQEEDPAAAFLAREKDELAELEEEHFADNSQGGDAFGGADQVDSEEPAALFADGAAAAAADNPNQMFDPLAEAAPADDAAFFDGGNEESSDPYASIRQAEKIRQEPEKIKKWREGQKTRLEEKDKASAVKDTEWQAVARKELEDWYKHRAEQFEKTKKINREGEDAFIQERDVTLPGDEWERVCRMCDFNPKSSRNSKDISRMRSILLQLKQTPIQRA